MRILIAEDEPLVAAHLKRIVEELNFKVVAVEHDFESSKNALLALKPNLALFDVRMEELTTGFKLAEVAKKINIPYVFISAHADKLTLEKANNLKPLGYIVKPFNKLQIQATLLTILKQFDEKFVLIEVGKTTIQISLNKLLYLKADNNYCEIVCVDKKQAVRLSLGNILDQIQINDVKRVSRSYAINENKITEINPSYLVLNQSTKIPFSKKYYTPISLHTK